MKRLGLLIAAFVFALGAAVNANAQDLRNASSQKVGSIESNGTIRNASSQKVGSIESDGTVRNASSQKIGSVESNGTVRNASSQKIGSASGVKKEWAAAFYFFDFFNK